MKIKILPRHANRPLKSSLIYRRKKTEVVPNPNALQTLLEKKVEKSIKEGQKKINASQYPAHENLIEEVFVDFSFLQASDLEAVKHHDGRHCLDALDILAVGDVAI